MTLINYSYYWLWEVKRHGGCEFIACFVTSCCQPNKHMICAPTRLYCVAKPRLFSRDRVILAKSTHIESKLVVFGIMGNILDYRKTIFVRSSKTNSCRYLFIFGAKSNLHSLPSGICEFALNRYVLIRAERYHITTNASLVLSFSANGIVT